MRLVLFAALLAAGFWLTVGLPTTRRLAAAMLSAGGLL